MRIALLSFILFALASLVPPGVFADDQTGHRTILEGLTFDQGSSVLKKAVTPFTAAAAARIAVGSVIADFRREPYRCHR